tara:strand:+ start:3186 stop:4229 length:1044 start_codon:yes stop_codon:yes gene_type:complete
MENKDIILHARPKSGESSVNAYSRTMNKMSIALSEPDTDPYSWIEDYERVAEYVDTLTNAQKPVSDATKRNYYVVCMIIVEGMNGGCITDKWCVLEEHVFYTTRVSDLNEKIGNQKKDNKGLTEYQQENVATIQEVDVMIEKLYRQHCCPHPNTLSDTNFNYVTAWILFCMYKEIPCRNELATLRLTYKRPYNALKPEEIKEHNWLIINGGKNPRGVMTIIRNKYKTSSSKTSGGVKKNVLSKELTHQVRKYLRIKERFPHLCDTEYLFPTLMNTYPNEQINLSKLLTRVTKEYLNGKKISTTLLCKINNSTPELQEAVATLQNIADNRGTSIGTIANTYVGGGGSA